jgi:hypothetical protein
MVFCEHGNEHYDFIKCAELLGYVKDFTPWSSRRIKNGRNVAGGYTDTTKFRKNTTSVHLLEFCQRKISTY